MRIGVFVSTAVTAAKVHLDAAPIADAASRQTVVNTTTALESALKDHSSIAAGFTALTAAARKVGVVPKPGSAPTARLQRVQ